MFWAINYWNNKSNTTSIIKFIALNNIPLSPPFLLPHLETFYHRTMFYRATRVRGGPWLKNNVPRLKHSDKGARLNEKIILLAEPTGNIRLAWRVIIGRLFRLIVFLRWWKVSRGKSVSRCCFQRGRNDDAAKEGRVEGNVAQQDDTEH